MPWLLAHSRLLRDVGESPVPIVAEEHVDAAGEARGAAGNQDALVEARTGFRQRSGLQVQVDVTGDEQVELAVPVIVEEG